MKRKNCSYCLKALHACFCHKINHYSTNSKIIILQHPTEVGHPLGTAQIAKLSLENCVIFVGENFSNYAELKKIIDEENCYLVFPNNENNHKKIESHHLAKTKTFIFIDGTWKKAQKILFINPWLKELPTLTLRPDTPSRYILRKAPQQFYLSTLEAICLTIKDYEDKDISQSLEVLDYIQNFQVEKMGDETFKKNYLKV